VILRFINIREKKIKKYQAERASNNLQHIQTLAQTDYYWRSYGDFLDKTLFFKFCVFWYFGKCRISHGWLLLVLTRNLQKKNLEHDNQSLIYVPIKGIVHISNGKCLN